MSDLIARIADRSPELTRALARMVPADMSGGDVDWCTWEAEDGWWISYTTTRIAGGPNDGKFMVATHKPVGPGARSGTATRYECNYKRVVAKRKTARAVATKLYYKRSPKAAARHGVTV